jgi:hypothetical protein
MVDRTAKPGQAKDTNKIAQGKSTQQGGTESAEMASDES